MCIWIINYRPGEIVYQPIIQLFDLDNLYHETILVNNKYQWPINQGLFKVNFNSMIFKRKTKLKDQYVHRSMFNLNQVKIKLNYRH